MAPEISQWVSKFFYKGQLQNHTLALQDNDYRKVARQMSAQVYGVQKERHGSEYWMVNVVNGASQTQPNGYSLQNYANAGTIARLVDEAIARGVPADKITVLTYYTGQKSVVSQKLEERAQAAGRTWVLMSGTTLSSVDSFQGEENEFVFVDIVVVIKGQGQTGPAAEDNDLNDEAEIDERVKNTGRCSAHVKSPNRLCCALTRGRSCVVVVAQLQTLFSTVKDKQTKAKATLAAMAKDFYDRKLICQDFGHLDISHAAVVARASWDQARLDNEEKTKREASLVFLGTVGQIMKKVRSEEVAKDTAVKFTALTIGGPLDPTEPAKSPEKPKATTGDLLL